MYNIDSFELPDVVVAGADMTIVPNHPAAPPEASYWTKLGFVSGENSRVTLPHGVVGISAAGAAKNAELLGTIKALEVPPLLLVPGGEGSKAFFRLPSTTLANKLAAALPAGVNLIVAGETVEVPPAGEWTPPAHAPASLADLPKLGEAEIGRVAKPPADPLNTSNPLLPYSLRGQSERFRSMAVEARPLLGDVALRGQVTIWYAAPGTGKTLIALNLALDAVHQGRIASGNIFYINADDNGAGFAEKLQIMDNLGAHTLSPGFNGLRTGELIALLHKMADGNEARGVLIIIDTIKKFASLMSKDESTAIASAFRQVAMKGGTILGLAHTTKNKQPDGTPKYAGTSDLVDDADAVYIINPTDASTGEPERVVEFRCQKARGDCAERAAYAFSTERGIAYEDLLASVRPLDPMKLDEFRRIEAEVSDAELLAAVSTLIGEGTNTKMSLMKEGALRTGASARAIGRLIERYTGDDPAQHRWRFKRGERGAQVFELLAAEAPPA